jgi:hypothetical protein
LEKKGFFSPRKKKENVNQSKKYFWENRAKW